MKEIHRLEQLVEEQSRTITSLASRNAELEVELASLPKDLQKVRMDKKSLEAQLERLRQVGIRGIA